MSWAEYVKRAAKGATQGDIAKAAGVTAPTVSRWLSGSQGVDPMAAARFARHYKRPVLEAFVAAGFLTEAEAKVRPQAAPSLNSLSDDELLAEVQRRIRRGGEHGAGNTAAIGKERQLRAVAHDGDGADAEAADEIARRAREQHDKD